MQVQKDSKELARRLTNHFQKEGYTFSLLHQSSGTKNVKMLTHRPTLLHCRGTSNEEAARHVDAEIRHFLKPQELQGLEIHYELKDYGYYISAKQLPTFRR